MKKFKQEITIGNSIDGIMKLPCVVSCHKTAMGSHYFCVRCVNADFADVGDKICEDHEGLWWVVKKGGEQ